MNRFWKSASRVLFCFIGLAILVSCASESSPEQHGVIPAQLVVNGQETEENIWVKVETPEKIWLPAHELMSALDFRVEQNERIARFGYSDPIFTVQADAFTAMFGNQPRVLAQAPRIFNDGRLHITVDALESLLDSEARWDPEKRKLEVSLHSMAITEARENPTFRITANKNARGVDLVRFAERFIGTPYDFGAEHYKKSGAFDCSSFVQYIYDRFGIDLPRVSIEQSHVGKRVSLNELKRGDLLFFYTPGRYASNRVVGHVGMYAGNGEMIHTYGDPGVTKDELDGYWEKRLLFAKRITE